MASISLEGIGKIYEGGTRALTDINLEINDGEFMVLVGPSGCGKSTLLRMIAGLEDITEGNLSIGENVVNDIPPKDRNIAMVFQNYALYPHMTVFDNMAFGLKLRKMPKDEVARRVDEAARILEITEYLDRKPKALSGGQRQRVAMGRAIVREPAAFLMDEPLSNLDAKLRVQMRSELGQLHARLKTTTVYVTHDQVEAMTMGDRVAVIRKGIMQQAETPRVLYDRPVNLFVAGFIGSPSMNFVYADLTQDGNGLSARFGDVTISLDGGTMDSRPGLAAYAGKTVVLGIRPESFEMEAAVDQPGEMPIKVGLVEQLGSEAFIHFVVDLKPVVTEDIRELLADEGADESTLGSTTKFVARINPEFAPKTDDNAMLVIDRSKLHFFDVDTSDAIY